MANITHFFAGRVFDEKILPYLLNELAANGAKYVVLSHPWVELMIHDDNFKAFLVKSLSEAGLSIWGAHAPFGAVWDLDTWDESRRPAMLEEQSQAIAVAAELGSRSITFHVGGNPPNATLPQLRDFTRASLEKLLPAAEENGIILCIENAMEPPSAPDELLAFRAEFDSPFLGFTYDSGHANVMSGDHGRKDPERYYKSFKSAWNGNIVFEDQALEKMAPHIVAVHLHDNNGYNDEHKLVGDGNIDWNYTMHVLKHDCPRLISLENENNAMVRRIPVCRFVKVFEEMMRLGD